MHGKGRGGVSVVRHQAPPMPSEGGCLAAGARRGDPDIEVARREAVPLCPVEPRAVMAVNYKSAPPEGVNHVGIKVFESGF